MNTKDKSKKSKKKNDKDDNFEHSKSENKDNDKDKDDDGKEDDNEYKNNGNDIEYKSKTSDDESGSMEFPVHRMYHRCAHCDYNYQPDVYYNSSHPQERNSSNKNKLFSSTTVILHCSHIFVFTSPSEVKPGHCVASITNNSKLDISGLRFELGLNLRTEQLLYPIMSPMNLEICKNIKWLVATAQDGRWPVGCPFEPINNLLVNIDAIQIRLEPHHINTIYNLVLELQDIIDNSLSDLQLSPTSLSYDVSTSSSSGNKKNEVSTHTTEYKSPMPTPPVPKSPADDDVFVSTPIPPPIDRLNDRLNVLNVSDDDENIHKIQINRHDGWDTPNSDEEQDQFDLEPNHNRLNSFSYSLSKSVTNTSVSHSGYHSTTSVSHSGMGNRWFFQNDLNSMKQSYRTDCDGRPFVNHIIYSEGSEILQSQNQRNNSLLLLNQDDGKDDEKKEINNNNNNNNSKKKDKKK